MDNNSSSSSSRDIIQSGYEWFGVDLEHSSITLSQAEEVIRLIDIAGKVPLVRLSENNATQIKRVMDMGAHGIIVPMVNSADDVKRAVDSLYYPPNGKRGVGLARAQGYGARFESYKEWLEQECIFIVQIEHKTAVENLHEILSCSEIDAFIVGPYDLSASYGVPGQFNDPIVKEALNKVQQIAKELQITSGYHVVQPESSQVKMRLDEGYKFIAYSVDFLLLGESCRKGFGEIDRYIKDMNNV